MDINQMRYFIGICEAESMAKASAKLHLSQQGLSVSIKRLEEELDCVLFYRKANGIVLTEAGERFREEASAILTHVSRIYEVCSSNKMDKSGRIKIGCSVADSLIVRLPANLQRLLISGDDTYSVNLTEGYSSECVDRVEKKTAVFAIVYGDWDDAKYDVVKLDTIKQVFIVNKKHSWADRESINLADLDGVPICASDERSRPRQELNKMFEKAGVQLNVSYICNRPRVTADLIANNPQLIARIVYDELNTRDLERIHVLELADVPFSISVSLVSLKSHQLNLQERLFKRLILNAYDSAE